ncbi:MAG: PAS domain S-box protein [Leptolyngbyaceae cyanobacterium bins.302]|nr:PAS domain S-box protein [Leptolyngbyaceae cyanobacterium bins.302]
MNSSNENQSTDPVDNSLSLQSLTQSTYDRSLQALFDSSLDAMLVADDDGYYLDVNPAACELLGLPKEQLLGKQIRDFSAQEFDFDQMWQAFLHQGQSKGEFEVVRADGTRRIVEYAATANFMPHRHLSVLRDISDRKQAEAEVLRLNQELEQRVWERTYELEYANHRLRQEIQARQQVEAQLQHSEQRLNSILSSLDDVIWSASANKDKVLYLNPAIEQISGYPMQAFMADPNFWLETVHPDDRERVQQDMSQLQAQGRVELLYRIVRPDGVIRWIRDRVQMITNSDGQPLRIDGIATDITDRKQVEAALRTRDEMLRKISLQIPGVVYQFQQYPDGRSCFPYASEAIRQIYGTTPEQVQETADPVINTLHPEDLAQVMGSIQHSSETLELWQDEYRVVLPRGVRWLEGHARPEKLPDGSVLWHGYIWDITERKQIEQELRQQAERERLLINITQHLRQSLDLDTILKTTVQEVLNVLQCDRVLVYQLEATESEGEGRVAAEALAAGYPSLHNEVYFTSCRKTCYPTGCPIIPQPGAVAVLDLAIDQGMDCPTSYLFSQNARAQLIIPILHQEHLWGMLIVHQCGDERRWQQWERDLLRAIADQVSIAIHQSYLYQQVQQFNVRLERQVEERTLELQQSLRFESLLKRITDRVRDSLNPDQILQTAVQELANGLGVVCCDAAIYSADSKTCTITHESSSLPTSAKGQTLDITETSHIHAQLLQGQLVQVCLLQPDSARVCATDYTVLACPLLDTQKVIGNLWLFKPKGEQFNDLEIRLAQQVANQCAIALRQSRLYQSAQAQVRELERLNQLKDDFLNTVSHELRTPMSNIKMATRMLEVILQQAGWLNQNESSSDPSYLRAAQYFQILNNECSRETNLINDLLDLSRMEAETDPFLWTTIRLQDWIPAIAEPFEYKTRAQNQQLLLQIADDLPSMITDLQYLERILTELLQNACKYSPTGETIAVAVSLRLEAATQNEEPTAIQITVRNTGVEIPLEELSHVFDKFYRVPNNDPWKHGGTGLGLALIKKLVERMHGTIAAHSSQGETQFVVTLPLKPPLSL